MRMRVDGPLVTQDLASVPDAARAMEAHGYDGAFTFEGPHDRFLPLVLAADVTERLELTTAAAIAFARNPLTLAHQAWDLQALSGGRFHLGLGSQVRAHVERRFSMPWSTPARRMRELVLAVRRQGAVTAPVLLSLPVMVATGADHTAILAAESAPPTTSPPACSGASATSSTGSPSTRPTPRTPRSGSRSRPT